MPRLAIDVTSYLSSRTGVGIWFGEIVKALAATSPDGEILRLCAVSARRGVKAKLKSAFGSKQIEVVVVPLPHRLLRPWIDRFAFPAVEDLFGLSDVFHASHLLVPKSRSTPTVGTVFDLTPIRYPEHHISNNKFTRKQLQVWIDRMDRVIAISASTARDLEENVAIEKGKVEIIPPGVRSIFRVLKEVDRGELSKIGLAGEFILAVGNLEPRKNLERLLRAFFILRESRKIPHRLVIVGPAGWKDQGIRRTIEDLRLREQVVLTGYLQEETLNVLYNAAAMLVYPSLYEGFGLPPLEAMAAGCPVAVSRQSSLPEVVGEAGIYFDPLQVEEMADSVYRVLASSELRAVLIARGLERSRRFTWENAAKELRRVYATAAEVRR